MWSIAGARILAAEACLSSSSMGLLRFVLLQYICSQWLYDCTLAWVNNVIFQVGKSTVLCRLLTSILAQHEAFGIGAPREVVMLMLDLVDLPTSEVISKKIGLCSSEVRTCNNESQ